MKISDNILTLTREQIAALFGRDLDAAIAEKVMGWHGSVVWIEDSGGRDPYLYEPGVEPDVDAEGEETRDNDRIVPDFGEGRPLVQAICTMVNCGWVMSCRKVSGVFQAMFDNDKGLGLHATDECFGLAVLRAALYAVEGLPLHEETRP